jgi:hypothetical protein
MRLFPERVLVSNAARVSPRLALSAALAGLVLTGCAGDDTRSSVPSPGKPTSATLSVLNAGAAALQSRPPVEALNAYLDGFHFYNGHPGVQMEAHHYCSVLSEEFIQCVIYDGNVRDAKLMGVEYIISADLFNQLPEGEKRLWHSHAHEVKSGQLVAPGIPASAEHALMAKLANTYGKTWHTWHTDQDKRLPLGVPQLMMGFTADGQADPAMVEQRNRRMAIDTEKKRSERADIQVQPVLKGADAWQHGDAVQLADPTGRGHVMQPGKPSPPGTNSRSAAPQADP